MGAPLLVASVSVHGPPVPLASAQLFEAVVASPKMSVPMLRPAPRFTVRLAAMSSVLKSATASTPSATRPPNQFAGVPRAEVEGALGLGSVAGHVRTWREGRRGPLQAGYDADLIVLRNNPLTCDWDDLATLGADITVVEGRVVHEASEHAAD